MARRVSMKRPSRDRNPRAAFCERGAAESPLLAHRVNSVRCRISSLSGHSGCRSSSVYEYVPLVREAHRCCKSSGGSGFKVRYLKPSGRARPQWGPVDQRRLIFCYGPACVSIRATRPPNTKAVPWLSKATARTAGPHKSVSRVVISLSPSLPVRSRTLKQVLHARCVPLPTTRRWDAACIESIGNLTERRCSRFLSLADNGQDVRRVFVRLCLHGFHGAPTGHVELGVTRLKGNERPEENIRHSLTSPSDWDDFKTLRLQRNKEIEEWAARLLDADLTGWLFGILGEVQGGSRSQRLSVLFNSLTTRPTTGVRSTRC
jgi:hypothetical protein